MNNLNPIYLLEVETKTIVNSANKVRNALIKGGISEKKAKKKVAERVYKMFDKRAQKQFDIEQLPGFAKDAVKKTPQYKALHRNRVALANAFRF